MKIQLFSDLHLEFEELGTFRPDCSHADVVVFAGDVHVGTQGVEWLLSLNISCPVIYVLGNHEYYQHTYPDLLDKIKELASNTNIFVLEDETVLLDGIMFHGATLWTDFNLYGDANVAAYECYQSMNDYSLIKKKPSFSRLETLDTISMHHHSVQTLATNLSSNKRGPNVVVTHHAPSILSLSDERKNSFIGAAYASNLEAFIKHYHPVLWLHGHTHSNSDYRIGECRVVCNPRGYPGQRNLNFDEKILIHSNKSVSQELYA